MHFVFCLSKRTDYDIHLMDMYDVRAYLIRLHRTKKREKKYERIDEKSLIFGVFR